MADTEYKRQSVMDKRMFIQRLVIFIISAMALGMLGVSCNGATLVMGSATLTPGATPKSTAVPTARPAFDGIYTEKVNLDAFAPPSRGRDLVIMNCDYCHSWVCAVRNQRTLDHWVLVENVHSGRGWVLLSDEDWRALFNYLEQNFNDRKPEPNLPPAFKDAGCTHSSYR